MPAKRHSHNLLRPSPSFNIYVAELERQIAALPQVQAVYHIHTWSLDGEHHVSSAHLVVDEAVTCAEVTALKKQVRALLNGHEFTHTAIEIKFANENCQLEEEVVC